MSDLLERIADLPPEKRELLRQRLKAKRKDVSSLIIARQPRDTNQFPLSFAQQRLWFLDQFEPNSAHYNMGPVYRLRGRLDVDALEQSFQTILSRHETLRTTFAAVDGQPVQIIGAVPKFKLPLVDLQNIPEAERESHARQLAQDEGRRPFDLTVGPLLRTKLLQLAPEEHLLLLTMHHIITDGWSTGLLLRELSTLYSAAIEQQDYRLPDLSIQYVDFAAWQRQWLQGDVLEKQLSYWREQLDNIPTALALPTDHARPPIQTFYGDRQVFDLSPPLSAALKKLSQHEGATLFMTLLAAFQVLLYRYSQQDDIVIGTPIANRNRSEIEGLIGFFINTLVMRSKLAGELSFLELLAQVKNTALSAYDHQDVPFEKLVQELESDRDLSRPPLFQVMLVLQNMSGKPLDLSGLRVDSLSTGSQTAKFDLTMYLREKNGQIKGSIEYNTDLFEATTIERLSALFVHLLEEVVANPDRRIQDLSLLPDHERQQLLVEWNDTETTYPPNETLASLFEGQVRRSPDRVALVFEDQELTYMELNRRANRLAHHLQKLGVGPEVLVGVFMERSIEMVVSLYATIKAGGTYLPVDPEYPAERIAFMLEDARPAIILTQEKLRSKLTYAQHVLILDGDRTFLSGEPASNPEPTAGPENLAYVIYTSGSTGQPKGVMNAHQGVVNRLQWMQDAYRLDESDCVLQKTPFSFDVSVWEFFWPLQVGARLVVARPGGHRDNTYLVDLIRAHGITTLHFVPSMLQLWIEERGLSECSSLQRVICSGEALPYELQQRFLERVDAELENLYGPTEAAVDVTYWHCERDSSLKIVPIGRPVANTQIYILDNNLEPVPERVAGELHIGGVQVARGYLNRPELTAEKFIPDPFSKDPAARLYKTGDLARYLQDGSIEFLGRIDHQVKIRGFRIELGEVESVLGRHPAVEEAVVIAREDVPGDKRLVAYVVASHEPTPTFSEMRSFLKEKLPDYMIPSALVFLDLLPLTPNGKVDRRALPAPDRNRSQPAEALVAPRDELELQLTKIWEKVLGVKNIGMKDNFFDLGGHSLLAVHLFARIQKIFGKDLPLTTLFQAPTIGQLAHIIRQEGFTTPWSSLVPIQHGGSKPPFFCVHGCTGKVLHLYDLARLLGPEQPFYGLSALGLEKGQVSHTQIEDMAAHYIKEIRTVQFNGPYFIGGSGDGCHIVLEMAHQLESQGQNLAFIVLLIPSPLKPNISTSKLYTYYRYRREFFRLLINLLKKRPLIPAIKYAFYNRVFRHYRIFHRFIPIEFRRWHRAMDTLRRARFSYTPRVYQGRFTCLLLDSFSLNYKKGLHDFCELAAGELDIQFVPGNNLTMWQEPHVQILAEKLTACLNEAQKNS